MSGSVRALRDHDDSLRLSNHYRVLLLVMSSLVIAAGVSFLPLSLAGIVIAGLCLGTLMIVRPIVGVISLALAVPFGSLVEMPLGEVPIGAVEPLVAILLLSWLARSLSRRDRLIVLPKQLLLTSLFLIVLAFEMTLAPSTGYSLKELLRWSELLIVAFVASSVIRTRSQITLSVGAILIAGVLEALVGWYQFIFRSGPPAFEIGRFLRAFGTFSQPNPFAGYLVMIWPLALIIVLHFLLTRSNARRAVVVSLLEQARSRIFVSRIATLATVATIVIGIAIVMSLSRGAWLGMVAAVLVGTAMYHRRAFMALLAIIVVSCVLIFLQEVHLLPAVIASRVGDVGAYFKIFDVRTVQVTAENWAVVERMASWQAAWGMFESNNLFGVGPGHYDHAYLTFAVGGWNKPLGHAHNFYLNVLAEMGIVGLIPYLLMLASWFAAGVHCLRLLGGNPAFKQSLERAIVIGVLASLVAASSHNLFDNLYVHGMNVHVGILLGLMLAISARALSRQPQDPH